MKKRILIVISIIILTVLSLGYFLLRPAVNYLSQYLSKSEYVKANVLIVEGWVPLSVLYKAASEFKSNDYQYIITTGIKNNTDYYELSPKGYLIFKAEKRFAHMVGDSLHLIEIDAYSKPGLDSRAHLRVYLNSEQIADVRPDKHNKMSGVLWKGDISKFDTVKLYFKNDNMSEFGNQSLYLKQIRIDSDVTIPYLGNSVFEIIRPDGNLKIKNNFTSNSELARNTLIAMGIDSSKVIATAGKETATNRTLASAIAFHEWSDSTGIKIEGINLITIGSHARRTWLTFNKVLNEKYRIGIIPVSDDSSVSPTNLSRMVKTIRETIGIMYYWIILTRY